MLIIIINSMQIVTFLFLFIYSHSVQIESTHRRMAVIVGTNDIHGHALPLHFTRTDNNQTYTQGGLRVLGALINIVKKEYLGNTLYFDSGDQFQGGVESSLLLSGGRLLNKFIDYMKLDGAAIGNHEFDYGFSFLEEFLASRETVNLAANLVNEEGREVFLPKQKISQIYRLDNGIKIGAIGLTTKTTPKRSPGWSLNDHKIEEISFHEYAEIVKTESKRLRGEGAHAVILVTHVGENCFINVPQYGVWTSSSKMRQCDSGGEIHKLLNVLPLGTVDGVLQGHYHNIAHNFIKDIPVMGNSMGGKYFNVLYLQFEGVKLVNATIEGPIPVCEKVFRNTLKCEYIDNRKELSEAGDLVNWKFHDKSVEADENIERMIKKELGDKIKPFLEVVCQNQKYLRPSYDEETELNNLLALSVQSTIPTADFTLLAPSLLREKFYPGPIRKLDIYNFHPFNSPFVHIKLSGKDFVSALRHLQSLEDSYHFSNQLEQTVWMTENHEKRGLIGVRWYNGSEIDPAAEINGIMHNFTLSFVVGKYNITRLKTFGNVREVFEKYLRKVGRIESKWALVDPAKPHLIVKRVAKQPQSSNN